jgi:glycine cleavage system H protein
MKIIPDLKYSKDHEWLKLDGSKATVGITDYAQDALGDIVFVELPEIGARFNAGDTVTEIESTKSVSEIYAPVAGKIIEVNTLLEDQPELVNQDPYGDGWIFVLEISKEAELDNLLDADSYAKHTSN